MRGILYVVATPIGNLPTPDSLDTSGLNVAAEDIKLLTSVDPAGWKKEVDDVASYYSKFNSRLPDALRKQLEGLHQRLE